jgi:hypothetical protein
MVRNNSGGSKSKNIGSKFTKKKIQVQEPDFENSFFGEILSKPNGLMTKVKILPCPLEKTNLLNETFHEPLQVNIGKMKHDKRNNSLNVGDIVQVEINFEMKRQNGNVYAVILCKYNSNEVRAFKKEGMISSDVKEQEEDDIFGEEQEEEVDLNNL